MDRTDVLALAGFGLLIGGIGLVFVPAALVVAGVVLLAASRVASTPEAS